MNRIIMICCAILEKQILGSAYFGLSVCYIEHEPFHAWHQGMGDCQQCADPTSRARAQT